MKMLIAVFTRNKDKAMKYIAECVSTLPEEEKIQLQEIIEKILEFKKRGYKIINTKKGLEYLANPSFERVCWITNFITEKGTRHQGCPVQNYEICQHCGLGMSGEMRALFDFNMGTILAGLNLRLF